MHCPVFQCPGRRASEAIVVFSLIVQFQKRLREEGRFSFFFWDVCIAHMYIRLYGVRDVIKNFIPPQPSPFFCFCMFM